MSVAIESGTTSVVQPAVSYTRDCDAKETLNDSLDARTRWQTVLKYAGSLADQSMVSGSRFLTSILIGSICGAAELGTYALGFSVLMGFHCIQLSLISRPYTIFGNQIEGQEKQELAGSALVQFFIFGLLVTLSLSAMVAMQYQLDRQTSLTPIFLTLALGAPFILLRDHARQFCFAHLNIGHAVLVDFTSTAIHVGGIFWLAWTGYLSASSALAVMTVASGVSGVVWLWMDRNEIRIVSTRVFSDFRRQWVIGKWDCASEIAFTSQIYGLTWLLAFMLDNASVGIYAACMMSVQVLNPFLLGINSVLVPKTVRAFSEGGPSGMHSFVIKTTVFVGSATAFFACITAIWGSQALEFLYRGQGFQIPAVVVAALVFGVVAEVIGLGPENGLWAMERQDFKFRVEIVSGIATLISAFALIPTIGLTGAALSFFIGRFVTSVAHWIAYRSATARLVLTK